MEQAAAFGTMAPICIKSHLSILMYQFSYGQMCHLARRVPFANATARSVVSSAPVALVKTSTEARVRALDFLKRVAS